MNHNISKRKSQKKYLMKQKKKFVPKMKTIISHFFNSTSDRRTDRHSLLGNTQKIVHNKKSIYNIYIYSSYYGPNVDFIHIICLSVCLRQIGQIDKSTIYFFSVIKIHFAHTIHYIFLWMRHSVTDIFILSFRKHIIPLQC